MVETNAGIAIMEQLLTATATPTPFDALHARLAIGDGNGSVPTAAATDTALAAPTNIIFLPMDPTFPTVTFPSTAWVMTWQGTATTTVGNFAWREWGVDNGGNGNSPGQTLFNHKGISMGTKTAGTTWTFHASVTQT